MKADKMFERLGYHRTADAGGIRYIHPSGAGVLIRPDGVDLTSVHGNVVELVRAAEMAMQEAQDET